jgi:hypothetical protein
MANYLITHYKGKYRLKAPYDLQTKMFPREYNGQFADNDVYIDCYNKIQIFSYGHGILNAYIPSLGRGHNIVKAIKEELGEDIIFNLEETDSEVLFHFHAKNIDKLEKYLKPKTSGANISPFSSKNLPKSKYSIPDEDLIGYKNIVEKIGQNRIIELTHSTTNFIKSLATKKNPLENIKADMALKGLKGKEYLHSIGRWNDYIKYLEKELCQN